MKKIQIDKSKPWGLVPESLITDNRLGHAAVRLGIWLTTRPHGWKVWKNHARCECRLGESSWDTATRELILAGYLVVTKRRVGGRFGGLDLEFDPQPKPAVVVGPTAHGATADGSVVGGKPTQLTRTLVTTTLKHKQQLPKQEGATSVVVDEVNCPRMFTNHPLLHWPLGLSPACVKAMGVLLDGVATGRRQELLDEVAGRMRLPAGVRSPIGLTRKLVALEKASVLVCELADGVRAARDARQAQLVRSGLLPDIGGATYSSEKSMLKIPTAPGANVSLVREELLAARRKGGKWA